MFWSFWKLFICLKKIGSSVFLKNCETVHMFFRVSWSETWYFLGGLFGGNRINGWYSFENRVLRWNVKMNRIRNVSICCWWADLFRNLWAATSLHWAGLDFLLSRCLVSSQPCNNWRHCLSQIKCIMHTWTWGYLKGLHFIACRSSFYNLMYRIAVVQLMIIKLNQIFKYFDVKTCIFFCFGRYLLC